MKKSTSIILIVLLLALIGGIGFFSYKLLFSKDKVLVPDFADKTRDEIVTWCNSLENNPCTFDNDYSETIPEGKLIYQSISADNELGDSISFIISLGKKIEIKLPQIDENTTKETIEKWKTDNNIPNAIEYIEQYNNDVQKGTIFKIEPNVLINTTDTIKVYISKGKDDNTESADIEITFGTYLDLSVSDFETKAKALGLVPNHNTDRDAKSSKVDKGKIVWHGSGSYVKGETINYGVCLEKTEGKIITVEAKEYIGKTLEEFKKTCEELGLKPEHSEVYKDEYSDTIAKGSLDWHGSGTYDTADDQDRIIHYTLSLGKKSDSEEDYKLPKDIEQYDYQGKTLDEFKQIAAKFGFEANHRTEWDDYSDTVAKGLILRNGSGNYTEDDTYISYGLSLGKKGEDETDSRYVHINSGTYIGYTYADFEKAVKALGVTPRHRTEWDDYSSTIAKGNIIQNGTGDYLINDPSDPISYGLSLGPKAQTKTVNVTSYAGKSETEFKNYLSNNNLKTGTRIESYSDNVAAGLLISNDTGNKNEGSYINYIVSKGKEPDPVAYIMKASKYQEYQVENSYSGTVDKLKKGPFAEFENVTYEGYKEENPSHTTGFIKEILVNNSSSYAETEYSTKTTVVKIIIYNN